jgi:hypothetical protein
MSALYLAIQVVIMMPTSTCTITGRGRMIDLPKAKELVERWLDSLPQSFQCPLVISDDRIEEHEWGWVIHCTPNPGTKPAPHQPTQHGCYVVDRMTGFILPIGSYGMQGSITRLLQMRKDQP